MLKPGTLTVDFVQGHRQKFTPPVRLYLIVSLLFFLIFPIIMPALSVDPAVAAHDPATEQYSRMMFLLLPVFALLLKLFYRQQFYMQHLVFSMHLFAAMFIVFTLMLSLENLANQSVLWVSIQSIVFGYMVWYCLTALRVVYENNWWVSSLKLLGLVILFLPTLSGALNLASLF